MGTPQVTGAGGPQAGGWRLKRGRLVGAALTAGGQCQSCTELWDTRLLSGGWCLPTQHPEQRQVGSCPSPPFPSSQPLTEAGLQPASTPPQAPSSPGGDDTQTCVCHSARAQPGPQLHRFLCLRVSPSCERRGGPPLLRLIESVGARGLTSSSSSSHGTGRFSFPSTIWSFSKCTFQHQYFSLFSKPRSPQDCENVMQGGPPDANSLDRVATAVSRAWGHLAAGGWGGKQPQRAQESPGDGGPFLESCWLGGRRGHLLRPRVALSCCTALSASVLCFRTLSSSDPNPSTRLPLLLFQALPTCHEPPLWGSPLACPGTLMAAIRAPCGCGTLRAPSLQDCAHTPRTVPGPQNIPESAVGATRGDCWSPGVSLNG